MVSNINTTVFWTRAYKFFEDKWRGLGRRTWKERLKRCVELWLWKAVDKRLRGYTFTVGNSWLRIHKWCSQHRVLRSLAIYIDSQWDCLIFKFQIWSINDIHKTAHRIRLRILSKALEKELRVLTVLDDIVIISVDYLYCCRVFDTWRSRYKKVI